MAKIEWTTKRKLGRTVAGMLGFVVGILTKFESLTSLVVMIKGNTANLSDYLTLFVPILSALLFFMFYWVSLKIIDWKNLQLDRIKELENELKKLRDQEEKHIDIENNHLLQVHINKMIAKTLDGDLEKNSLIAFINHHGENPMYKFIQRKNSDISDDEAKKIAESYEGKGQQFHKPI